MYFLLLGPVFNLKKDNEKKTITERGVAGFSFEFAEYPTRRLLYPSIRRLRLGVFYKDQGFKVGGER